MRTKTTSFAAITLTTAMSLAALAAWTNPSMAEVQATTASANLNDLAFAGEVAITAPSVHSPKYYLTVSNQVSTYATGLQLFVRQYFPQGMCTSFTIFNFESNELTQVSAFGNPGCGSVEAPAPAILKKGDSGYAEAVAELTTFVRQVTQGFYVSSAPEPRLLPTLKYLDEMLKSVSN
jgi:hypothetical protein